MNPTFKLELAYLNQCVPELLRLKKESLMIVLAWFLTKRVMSASVICSSPTNAQTDSRMFWHFVSNTGGTWQVTNHNDVQ